MLPIHLQSIYLHIWPWFHDLLKYWFNFYFYKNKTYLLERRSLQKNKINPIRPTQSRAHSDISMRDLTEVIVSLTSDIQAYSPVNFILNREKSSRTSLLEEDILLSIFSSDSISVAMWFRGLYCLDLVKWEASMPILLTTMNIKILHLTIVWSKTQ